MRVPLPPPGPGRAVVVASAADPRPAKGGAPLFLRGQAVFFQVIPSGRAGEARIRIGTQVYSAVSSRPLAEGAAGKAVVKSAGPPLLLQVTEWPAAPALKARLPVLLGKEPPGAGMTPAPALAEWNASLRGQLLAEAAPPSAERLREGILLARFLAFALGAAAETERPPRKDGPAPGGKSREPGPCDAGPDGPFWFFIPVPGERGPLLFPGYRRREQEGSPPCWGIFLRLPDVGPVSARLFPAAGGWRLLLLAESEAFVRALADGAGSFARAVKDKGFPLLDVAVRKAPRGQLEAEVGAKMSRDTGIPLVEKTA